MMDVDFDRYEALDVERDGPILRVWFNRPDQLNAIDAAVHAELGTLFGDIDRDTSTKIAVLSGRGRAFSAGGDIDHLLHLHANPLDSAAAVATDRAIQAALLEMQTPLVAAVNGPAVGLGCSLALFCDVVIAADDAYFADPHVSVGLVAGDGGALLWPQLIGYMQARRYLLTGERITGEVAERLGLVTVSTPRENLDEVVETWVERLLAQPEHALRWTKLSINAGLRLVASAVLDTAAGYENVSQLLPAHGEALAKLRDRTRRPS
jgi:enoyl-CoA hydratase